MKNIFIVLLILIIGVTIGYAIKDWLTPEPVPQYITNDTLKAKLDSSQIIIKSNEQKFIRLGIAISSLQLQNKILRNKIDSFSTDNLYDWLDSFSVARTGHNNASRPVAR